MQPLKIKRTTNTPLIDFDSARNIFLISGISSPEDAFDFYMPLLLWFEDYMKNPNEKTVFEFKLPYYNTSSSKLLLNLMTILETLSEKGFDVLVKWNFPKDDEDVEEAGEEYADIVEVPFEFISY